LLKIVSPRASQGSNKLFKHIELISDHKCLSILYYNMTDKGSKEHHKTQGLETLPYNRVTLQSHCTKAYS
jgi:hypothetical protein